jgi:hypothetical protein
VNAIPSRWGSASIQDDVSEEKLNSISRALEWVDQCVEGSKWAEHRSPQGVCLLQTINGFKVTVHPLESLQQDLGEFNEFPPGHLAVRINGFGICIEMQNHEYVCPHLDITASFLQLLKHDVPVAHLPDTVLMTTHPDVFISQSMPEELDERQAHQEEQNTCIAFMDHCHSTEAALAFLEDEWETGIWSNLQFDFPWELHPDLALGLARYLMEHRFEKHGDIWFVLKAFRDHDTPHYHEHVLPFALQHKAPIVREYAAVFCSDDTDIDRWTLLSPLLEDDCPVAMCAHISISYDPDCTERLEERTRALLNGELEDALRWHFLEWLSKNNDVDDLLEPFFRTVNGATLSRALRGVNVRGDWLPDCVEAWVRGALEGVEHDLVSAIAKNTNLDTMGMFMALMNTKLPQVQIEVLGYLAAVELDQAHRLLDMAWRTDSTAVFDACHRVVNEEFKSYPGRFEMYEHWRKHATNSIRHLCEQALSRSDEEE